MEHMEHIVSIKETPHLDSWSEQAVFKHYVDASDFARRLSNQDRFDRVVRVGAGRNYINSYFRCGDEIEQDRP